MPIGGVDYVLWKVKQIATGDTNTRWRRSKQEPMQQQRRAATNTMQRTLGKSNEGRCARPPVWHQRTPPPPAGMPCLLELLAVPLNDPGIGRCASRGGNGAGMGIGSSSYPSF